MTLRDAAKRVLYLLDTTHEQQCPALVTAFHDLRVALSQEPS